MIMRYLKWNARAVSCKRCDTTVFDGCHVEYFSKDASWWQLYFKSAEFKTWKHEAGIQRTRVMAAELSGCQSLVPFRLGTVDNVTTTTAMSTSNLQTVGSHGSRTVASGYLATCTSRECCYKLLMWRCAIYYFFFRQQIVIRWRKCAEAAVCQQIIKCNNRINTAVAACWSVDNYW